MEVDNGKIAAIAAYFQVNSSFWITWLISLLTVILLGVVFQKNNQPLNKQIKETKNIFSYLIIAGFCFFCLLYIYLILDGAEFAYHDSEQFTFFSLQGKFFGMPIWPSAGRYWPLGLQEYNFIGLVSKTPLAYHSFSILQLLIVIFLCLSILSPINLNARIFIITIILTLSSFVISFFGLIFPERNLIFWLTIFIFCLIKYNDYNSLIYLCGAFISVQFLLYYKEPSFIVILGFASTRLIIQFFQQQIWRFKLNQILTFIKENWLDFGLIILSLVFLFLYISNIQGQVETSYVSGKQEINSFSTLISYLKINPVLSLFILFFSFRIFSILLGKQKINLIWDPLAIGNLLYFLVYIKLNIFRWYYTAPVDFIAILYLVQMVSGIWTNPKKHKYKIPIVISLLSLIVLVNLHYSSYAILSRKTEIESRIALTNFLRDYIDTYQIKDGLNLFFPNNSGYDIMQFSSYLNYKKFLVLIDNDQVAQQSSNTYLVMQGLENFPDNLCISYRPFKCFHVEQPTANDLIVYLPVGSMLFVPSLDQYEPSEFLHKYGENSVQAFHYQPKFTGVRSVLYFFCQNLIDEQWLNAYVFNDFGNVR